MSGNPADTPFGGGNPAAGRPRCRLGVNVDHVATIRNARGGAHPDPVRVAELALAAGADNITAHLREDRRHVRDEDIEGLRRLDVPLNFEMAATEEMVAIAERVRPHAACLVPERREERTTEGGLDVAGQSDALRPLTDRLAKAGARVSLFIDPDEAQVRATHDLGVRVIELHTGDYAEAALSTTPARIQATWQALDRAAALADGLGIEVHAGHGLTFQNVQNVAAIPAVQELNIGHFLIGEALVMGLPAAIREMRRLIDDARTGMMV